MLALMLIFFLVLVPTSIASTMTDQLTQEEIERFGENEFGMISYGHFYTVFEYAKTNDESKTFETQITLYNTNNKDLPVDINVYQYSEERVHDTIRENYTYYKLPDLSWVDAPQNVEVPSNNKLTFDVTITMPVEDAYEQRKEGGYIFLIVCSAQDTNIQSAPGFKVFITLLDQQSQPFDLLSSLLFILQLIIVITLLLILSIFVYNYYKQKKKIKIPETLMIFITITLLLVASISFTQAAENINCTFDPHYIPSDEMDIRLEFPDNTDTEVARAPENLSAWVNGTNLDVYIYFFNKTATVHTWTLLESWESVSSARYGINDLDSINGTLKQFVWGNTTYTWSVNVTNSTGAWLNESYTYTTIELATGANARYDVNNDTSVDIQDTLLVWNNRDGEAEYKGIYDVSETIPRNIGIQDALYVWNGKS